MCSLGIVSTTFALLTQCSTTEPHEHRGFPYIPNTNSTGVYYMAACGSCWLWLWWGNLRGFGWAVLDCLSSYDCSTLSLCIWLAAHAYRCESSSVDRVICLICRHPLWKKPQEVVTQLQTFLIINCELFEVIASLSIHVRGITFDSDTLSSLIIQWKFNLSGSVHKMKILCGHFPKWKFWGFVFRVTKAAPTGSHLFFQRISSWINLWFGLPSDIITPIVFLLLLC